jgi:hypothetical protein
MEKVQFIGRVLPSAVKITVHAPELKWKWEQAGIEPTFRVKIGNSFINVECEVDAYQPTYFTELYRRAFDLAKAATNLVAFAHGYGLTVIFDIFVAPDGVPSEIAQIDPSLPPLCTAYSLEPGRLGDFNAVFTAVLTQPTLFMALEELIHAITVPHVSAVNCARAMDRLKHLIAVPEANEKQAWKQMRDALQIDEEYLKFISDVSKNPRHGRPGHTPGSQTTEATKRSWAVMNRYFEYVKRGKQPLPETQFPLLK